MLVSIKVILITWGSMNRDTVRPTIRNRFPSLIYPLAEVCISGRIHGIGDQRQGSYRPFEDKIRLAYNAFG